MWTKSKSMMLTRVAVILFLVSLTTAAILLPMLLRWYIAHRGMPESHFLPTLILGWICVIPAFIALVCMHKILKNIQQNKIFTAYNVRLFRILSWCCLGAAIPFLIYGFWSMITVFFSAILAFIALLLRVAKNMLETAVELKNENDLTV